MGLLFFGGIVNLFWIAGLACFVLLEKTIPIGHWIGRIAGVAFAVWGVVMLASAASSS
jgi:predicted metal-binding membrane protein